MSNRLGFALPGTIVDRRRREEIREMGSVLRPVGHRPRVTGRSVGAAVTPLAVKLILSLPAWMDDAACTTIGTEIFYPDGGGNGADARKICDTRCPVRAECLADAVEFADRHGVRGGTTANQRKPLIEARIAELAAQGLKRCEGTCRQVKPLSEFDGSGGGIVSRVYECHSCRDEQWRLEDHTRAVA